MDPRALSSAVRVLNSEQPSSVPLQLITCLTPTVSGHPVLLLPVTKTEPESPSGDETDVSDSHIEGVSPSETFYASHTFHGAIKNVYIEK